MAFALSNCRIFDGDNFRDDHAVVISDGRVRAILRSHEIALGTPSHDLGGGLLVPGFVDIQVNGGGGALLNDGPNAEIVNTIALSHRRFGTVGLLPTVITDHPDVLTRALDAVRQARRNNPAVLGVHVEGPFLDVARKGAHDPALIRQITVADVQQLIQADCGRVLVTVAPNKVAPHFIQKLSQSGVLVGLGHAEATYTEVKAALAAGAMAFTHLFNAMSQMTGREPGMVGGALSDTRSFIGIIADGFHVDDASLRIALAATNHDRFMLVTDAMSTAAGGPGHFDLQGRQVRVIDGKLQLDDGTLAGSNLTMDEAVRYAANNLGLDLADSLRMASLNPARFLKLDGELGRIAAGYRASLVHLDDKLNVLQTWVDGA